MKRAMTALLALALLAGCAGGEVPSSSSPEPAPPQESAAGPQSPEAPGPVSFSEADFDLAGIKADLAKAQAVCMEVLEPIGIREGDNYYMPESQHYRQMADKIGVLGFACEAEGQDMTNHQQVLDFYESVNTDREASVTVYSIHNTMAVADCFATKGGKVAMRTVYHDFPVPSDEPGKDPVEVGDFYLLDDFWMTGKGYLLYSSRQEDSVEYGGYRVVPLGAELYALTDKYALPFDRYYNNLASVDWDGGNLDDVHMLYAFEHFYWRDGGLGGKDGRTLEEFPLYNGQEYHYAVPAALAEDILTKHMDVTVEYLRAKPCYDAAQGVYDWEVEPRGGVLPTPEVVKAVDNPDGTKTLTIDAVNVNSGSDRLYGTVLTVGENPDGSVKYLSGDSDHEEMYPWFHLYETPVILMPPATEEEQAVYDAASPADRKLYRAVGSYLLTQAFDHITLPGAKEDLESRLRYVVHMFESELVTPDFDCKAGYDAGQGAYTLPRAEFDRYLLGFFPGIEVDEDSLVEKALMTGDKTAYVIPSGGYGSAGAFRFGWVENDEDGNTTATVLYYFEENKDMELPDAQFHFVIDLRPEVFRFLSVTESWRERPGG